MELISVPNPSFRRFQKFQNFQIRHSEQETGVVQDALIVRFDNFRLGSNLTDLLLQRDVNSL